MDTSIELRTTRLALRPVSLDDADEIETLVSERDVAATTASIPHPYPKGGAAEYIRHDLSKFQRGASVQFIARTLESGTLIGAVGLAIDTQHQRAEIGYWIGKPFWNSGFCTEAAEAVLDYAFRELGLNRVFAHHMTINPASGRILSKLGMQREATLCQHVVRFGAAQDVDIYGITRSTYAGT